MKHMKTLRLLLFFLFISWIGDNLFAQTASVTEGCASLTVTFTPPSGQSSFFWDFKDGATSVLQNPSHIFALPGVYNVEFKNSAGGAVIGTVLITVYAKPDLDVVAAPDKGCAPLSVELQSNNTIDPNITVFGYRWVYGDGEGGLAAPTVVHTYNNTGSYTVSLSLETNFASCNVTELFEDLVEVTEPPIASFTTSPDPAIECEAPFSVTFTNTTSGGTGNLMYSWNYGNGNTSTGPTPDPQTYLADGQYSVVLTVTDENNCTSTFTKVVSVGQPSASFVVADTVCIGGPVILQNTSSDGQYVWDFGPNATPQGSTDNNPTVTFNTPGQHTITLTVTSADGLCSDMMTQNIVAEQLDISFTAVPDYSCSEPFDVVFTPSITTGGTYFWTFGDDSTSTEINPTHSYANPDTTIYSINGELMFIATLTVVSSAGCSDSFTDTILLHQPNALFEVDQVNGCGPLTVTFTDQSTSNENITSWEWIFGDGNSMTNANNNDVSHTYLLSGEYEAFLVVENSAGCRDTSYALAIEVGNTLFPNFTIDRPNICPGDTVNFIDMTPNGDLIDAWHFSSDNDRTFHCFNQNALSWPFDSETGIFDVTLTVEYNGCYSSLTQVNLITVNGPIADIDYEIDCERPFEVQFNDASSDATSVSWDFGDMTTSTQPNPLHVYTDTGDYVVKLTAINNLTGCPASVDSVVIHIRDIQSSFELDTLLCIGQTYMLDATTSQGVRAECWRGYTWYFESTRPITTQDSIIDFAFNQPGRDSLTLVVTDINGCKDTSGLEVRVFGVYPDAVADKDTICFPSTVNFMDMTTADTTIVKWEWDFGDGQMFEGQTPPPHLYSSGGGNPIQAMVTITDAVGCGGSQTIPIAVYAPFSTITTDPGFPGICVGESIDFTASDFTDFGSNLSFQWDFGNGGVSANQMASTSYNTAGTFTVNLEFTEIATGCMDSTSIDVFVQDFPEANFSSSLDDNPVNCAPIAANFTDVSTSGAGINAWNWTFGNGQGSSSQNPSTNYDAGTYDVTMTVSTSFGCSDEITRTFTIVQGPAGNFSVEPSDVVCKGENLTFTLVDTTMVTSFSWDFGDGTIVDDQNPVTHSFTEGGARPVTLILRGIDNQCEVPIIQTINVQNTTASFNAMDACIVDPTVIFDNTSTDATIFSWNFGDGTTSQEEDPTHIYGGSGSFDVTLSVQDATSGCSDEITQTVNILPQYSPDTVEVFVCLGEDVTLSTDVPAGYQVSWEGNFASQLSCQDCPNPVLNTNDITNLPEDGEPLIFTLVVTDNANCGGGSAPYIVYLPNLQVPDVFTPNADGTNDFFNYVQKGSDNIELEVTRFQVFSRWGKLVYDNENPDRGWSGQVDGKMAPSDVYMYNIEISTSECTIGKMKGDVTLIR